MVKFEVNQLVGKKIPRPWFGGIIKKTFKIAKFKKSCEISIATVNNPAIKRLNRLYRGKNRLTDVLSFGEKISEKNKFLGEVIISYPIAKKQAKEHGHSLKKELEILLVHGLLHLLGYDHEKNKEAVSMERLERKIRG